MRFIIYCLLLMFGVFPKDVGLSSPIQTHQTVMAAVGEEAHFSCRLMEPKDVLQVTWQKVLPDYDKNMATTNKYFGQRVNYDFRNEVEFKDAGLQNSSIVIRNVTEQDEGCYRCMWYTTSEAALSAKTCLKLYELHEPILHVRESNSTEESVVSCSVTARPAPTVTLTVTQHHLSFSHYNTVTVNNNNGTVTVTTTAVLSGSHGDSTQVGCAVRVPSGPQKEVLMNIPEVKQTSADGFDEESGSENITWTAVVLAVLVACGCVAAVITVLLMQKHKNRTRAPLITDHIISEREPRMLLFKQENELRQRSSLEKTQERNNPKPPPSTTRKFNFNQN